MSVSFIAEIANSHQGDIHRAIETANQAILSSGADYVKFQVYTADELLVKSHKRYEHFKSQSFSSRDWQLLFSSLKFPKEKIFCDVFGLESLNLCLDCDIANLKIHSSDIYNIQLLEEIKKHKWQNLIVSAGGCGILDIIALASCFKSSLPETNLIISHGFQAYPTNPRDTNLNKARKLASIFSGQAQIALQDHIDANSFLARSVIYVALGMGIKIFEKHITLERESMGVDYYSSLTPSEFNELVSNTRLSMDLFGDDSFHISESELAYQKATRKYPVSSKFLPAKSSLDVDSICYKRVDRDQSLLINGSIDAKNINYTAVRDISANSPLLADSIVGRPLVIGLIICRMTSSRLPEKAFLELNGIKSISLLIERAKKSKRIDKIVLCTTSDLDDDPLEFLARDHHIDCFRGDKMNVASRMWNAMDVHSAHHLVRLTGDDPLVDFNICDQLIEHHLANSSDYSYLVGIPSGVDAEILSRRCIETIAKCNASPEWTEYLRYYISDNLDIFKSSCIDFSNMHYPVLRLTLDTKDDFKVLSYVCEELSLLDKLYDCTISDIHNLYQANPSPFRDNNQTSQKSRPAFCLTHLDLSHLF